MVCCKREVGEWAGGGPLASVVSWSKVSSASVEYAFSCVNVYCTNGRRRLRGHSEGFTIDLCDLQHVLQLKNGKKNNLSWSEYCLCSVFSLCYIHAWHSRETLRIFCYPAVLSYIHILHMWQLQSRKLTPFLFMDRGYRYVDLTFSDMSLLFLTLQWIYSYFSLLTVDVHSTYGMRNETEYYLMEMLSKR